MRARTQFPALALRLDDEALAEALAEEFVTVEPCQREAPVRSSIGR